MIVCPMCQHHNPPEQDTCQACSASLSDATQRVCPVCGALNDIKSEFCHRCLSDLAPLYADGADDASFDETNVSPEEPPAEEPTEPTAAQDAPMEMTPDSEPGPDATAAPEFLVPDNETTPSTDHLVPPMDHEQELAWLQTGTKAPQDLDAMPGWTSRQDATRDEAPAPDAMDEVELPSDETVSDEPDEAPIAPFVPPAQVVRVSDADMVKPQVLDALQELDHTIPIETAVALPHRSRARSSIPTPEIEREDASLFQRIANEPPSLTVPAHTLMSSAPRTGSRWATVLLNLLVIAAVVVPFLTNGVTEAWITPRPQSLAAVDALAAIEPNETVLVAFDYTPAYAGELDAMAYALTRQLARQGCQVVVLSTEPTGPAIAEGILDQVAQDEPSFVYGDNYVVLGYLAGDATGIRALANPQTALFSILQASTEDDPPGLDALDDSVDPDSIENVVLLAEDVDNVVRWIEQTQNRRDWLLHAYVSSRIAPALAPYYQSGQLETLLGAADSTIEFEIAADMPATTGRHADSQSLVVVLVVLVAVLANAYAIASGSARRRRS